MKTAQPTRLVLDMLGSAGLLRKSAEAKVPDTNIFCRLGKVDVANRTVYGRAVQEVPDASGEIFDYAKSKPYFEAWVNETKEATKGKSLGNIRAMHGNTAAGKAVEVTFQDDECAIDIAAKIVDDNEWEKVLEGVYTGFSIGGQYVGEKVKEGDLFRYTASPIEISLVDKPCIPTAMFSDIVKAKGFDVVKADGKTEHKEFAEKSFEVTVIKAEPDDAPEVTGTAADTEALAKVMTEHKLDLGKVVGMVKAQMVADAPKRFADEANKKYPLDNGSQVCAAWYFINTAKAAEIYKDKPDDLKAIKEATKAAWIERFKSEPDEVAPDVAQKTLGVELTKGFWNVSSAANMLSYLAQFMGDMEYYEEAGMVGEGVTGKMSTVLSGMGDAVAMILAHAIADSTDAGTKLAMQSPLDALTKAGARHSKEDAARLQAAHDLLEQLGAAPTTVVAAGPEEDADDEGGTDAEKAARATLRKAAKAKDGSELAKAFDLIKGLQEQVKKLGDQPMPAKAIMRVVEKSQDAPIVAADGPRIEPVFKKDGSVDEVATLMKLAQKLPVGQS